VIKLKKTNDDKEKEGEKKEEKQKEEAEAEGGEIEHYPLKSLIYPFEVIVSPFKAFKEIAQNPGVKGFLLIIVLFIATSIGVEYVYGSKIFVGVSGGQPVLPKLDTYLDAYVYVTSFGNYTFKSNAPYTMNYTFINETPLTQYTIFWVNTTETLTPANPLVIIANDTFYQTTVDLNQTARKVGNLSLTAKFSQYERPKFSVILNKTAEWNLSDFTINWFIRPPSPYTYLANLTTTLDLTSEATLSLLQTNVTTAELGNTNSINDWKFSILSDWSDYGNATIYGGNTTLFTYSGTWLDVVFGANDPKIDFTTVNLTYSALVNTSFFGDQLLFYEMFDVLSFFFSWLVYAVALFLIANVFGEQRKEEKSEKESTKESEEESEKRSKRRRPWLPFFILVGYVFSVFIVRSAVSAVLISTLPKINFQLATQSEVTLSDRINAIWSPTLANKVGTYFNFFVEAWFTMLGAIAVHASRKMPWAKAIMISIIAYFIYFTVRMFIGF